MVEAVRIESTSKMEEIRIENRVQLTKVYIGSGDDFIIVSGNDNSIVKRFLNARNNFIALAESLESKSNEIIEKYDAAEGEEIEFSPSDIDRMYELEGEFAVQAEQIMDSVFGEGTTKKFFGDVYEVIPNFVPSEESFMDFFDALNHVIERLSEHKVKLEKLASQKRMSKYQPQDHKKPQKKGTVK